MAMKTLTLLVGLLALPAAASAQTPPSRRPPDRVQFRGEVIPVDGYVMRDTWVHARSSAHYTPPEPRRSLAPTVVQAVRRDPF